MQTRVHSRVLLLLAALLASGAVALVAVAEESKSTPLAKELGQLLDQAKLDTMAAKDPSSKDGYVAALYFPGSQLLVVAARYAVPPLLDERIAKKEYRDVYTDLNSASIEGSRWLVMDLGADGLKPRRDDNRLDSCDTGAKSISFDGEWKKQKIASEGEYDRMFAEADARYATLLAALIAQVKK